MNFPRWRILALVCCIGAGFRPGSVRAEVFSSLSFDAAREQASERNKLVLVEVSTSWSRDGKRMKESTWNNQRVIDWVRAHAVAARVDADRDPAWALAHRVGAFPTVLLLSPDGRELFRRAGFTEAEVLIAALEDASREYRAGASSRPAAPSSPQNPLARQIEARRLAEQGDAQAALTAYLWCLDEGSSSDPAYTPIRNSLLLRELTDLGRGFPPALEALRQRRDDAVSRLREGRETPDDPVLIASINRQLDEEERTVALYDDLLLKPTPPGTLSQLARLCFSPLLGQRRYRDIQLGYPHLFEDALREFDYYTQSAELADRYPQMSREEFDRSRLSNLREKVSQYYEVLVAIQANEAANKLAARLLEVDASAETCFVLADRAMRAGRPRANHVALARKADELTDGKDLNVTAVLAELMAMTGQVDDAVTLLQERLGTVSDESAAARLRAILERMPRYAVPPPLSPASAPADGEQP